MEDELELEVDSEAADLERVLRCRGSLRACAAMLRSWSCGRVERRFWNIEDKWSMSWLLEPPPVRRSVAFRLVARAAPQAPPRKPIKRTRTIVPSPNPNPRRGAW